MPYINIGTHTTLYTLDLKWDTILERCGFHINDVEGTSIRKKFADPALPYETHRIWDAIARLFVGLPPCCAVYPDPSPQKPERLLVAFNKDITDDGKTAIRNVWNKIKEISAMPEDRRMPHFPDLLSMVMNMQEYKIFRPLEELTKYLSQLIWAEGIEEDGGMDIVLLNCSNELKSQLKELIYTIQSYTGWANRKRIHFNECAGEQLNPETAQKLRDGIDQILDDPLFAHLNIKLDYNPVESISCSIMQLNVIINELVKHVTPDGNKLLSNIYGKGAKIDLCALKDQSFCNSFSRVMQDTMKVVSSLPKKIEDIDITFVGNEGRLHAELAILHHRILEIWDGSPEKFIDSMEIVKNYIGVSKLSCEQCYIVFKLLDLHSYVILFPILN